MNKKEALIVKFLLEHNLKQYYIDIRDELSLYFDNESDFDKTLYTLVIKNIIYENTPNDTLYVLKNRRFYFLKVILL